VHVAVDDASRLAYVEVLPDEGGGTAAQFLWRARAWFRRHGIRVRRVLTDNGAGYVSDRFARLCRSIGVRHHLRTRPYTPRTNGKAGALPPTWRAPRSSAHHSLGGPEQSRGSSKRASPSTGTSSTDPPARSVGSSAQEQEQHERHKARRTADGVERSPSVQQRSDLR